MKTLSVIAGKLDLPAIIIIAALLVSAPRLAAALSFVEPAFLGLPIELMTGPAFGLSTAGATVYVWHTYQRRDKIKHARLMLCGWIVLLAFVAIILVPGMVVELRKSELAELLKPPLDIIWCSLLAISSELVVGLAALARTVATPKQRVKKSEPALSEPQAKMSEPEVQAIVHRCDRCGATANKSGIPFATKQAVNAHKRFCKGEAEWNGNKC